MKQKYAFMLVKSDNLFQDIKVSSSRSHHRTVMYWQLYIIAE